MIASESCFASGVDHCLASDEDHLKAVKDALNPPLAAPRSVLRACAEIIDLIAAICKCYRRMFSLSEKSKCKYCQPRAAATLKYFADRTKLQLAPPLQL